MVYIMGRMVDGKVVPLDPNIRINYGVQEELPQVEPLVDPLADVIAWREKNPLAWEQMVMWALEDAVSEQGRCSAKLYIELLRRPHFARKLGFTIVPMNKQVKITNNLTPYFARLMMQENPELRGHFRTGKVPSDSW